MSKLPDTNPSSPQKEQLKLFDGLIMSVAGLVGALVILVGLAVLLIFQPEISSRFESNDPKPNSDIPAPLADPTIQLVDGKDLETALLAGEGLELVKANCTACHSSALILQNRFTREGWNEKIVWMQETQGLWDLGENEAIILDYLAANYAPEAARGRRIPLSGIEWYELKD